MAKAYDVFEDDKKLREMFLKEAPGDYFRNLRNSYQFRNEFSSCKVGGLNPSVSLYKLAKDLEFKI